MINLPIVAFCFGIPALFALFGLSLVFRIVAIIFGFAIGIVISWKWWAYFVSKWRLWAFDNLADDDLITLKELAITNKLIWYDDSGFEQFEIRTKSDHDRLDPIFENISELEQIEELKLDLTTPDVYSYKLSKRENIVESLAMILILVVSIFILFTDVYFVSIILWLFIVKDLKNLKYVTSALAEDDYLVFTEDVIRIGSKEFIDWKSVERIGIDRDERLLTIHFYRENKEKVTKFDLWRLESYEYNKFSKILDLFIERYRIKYLY